jgi:hypothetical protein
MKGRTAGNRTQSPLVPPDICKFFQAGHCKYGSKCRFAHVAPSSSLTSSSAPPVLADEMSKAVEAVRHDLQEVNIQWPFSCYGIALDWHVAGNIISGDYSFEELRLEAYAQRAIRGNIAQYEQQVRELAPQYARRRLEVLRNPQQAIDHSRQLALASLSSNQVPLQAMNMQPSMPLQHPASMLSMSPIQQSSMPFVPSAQQPSVPAPPPFASNGIAPQISATSMTNARFEFGKIPEDLAPPPT